jgi:signal transduction histidine kinase
LVAAVTGLLVAGELTSGRLVSYDPAVAPTTEELVVSLVLVAPLAFGPRAPVAVFAAVMATCLVQLAVTEHVLVADLAPLVALYYLIVHGPGRLKPIGLGIALAGGIAMSARASFPGVLDGFILGTAVVTAYVLVAALLADRRVATRARLAALEVERDQQAELGAARERARIARELHDVVAHSLAVMVAQADGGRYAAREDPDAASRALAQIAESGRDALAQMRRLLGLLRAGEEGGDLPGLVRRLAGAGLPVELEVEGRARELSAELQLCIHRVAQEALTNVLKHADSPRHVEVVLRYLDSEVELSVRDDGCGVATGDGQGHGLAGMRERVALHSGTLHAGPRAGGGYEVRARLPAPAGDVAELRA